MVMVMVTGRRNGMMMVMMVALLVCRMAASAMRATVIVFGHVCACSPTDDRLSALRF